MNIFKRKSADDSHRKRQPQGVPSGGQFAADTKPEADGVALQGLSGRDRTEALIMEAEKVYGEPVKAVNAAIAVEVMEEADRQANLADGCLAKANSGAAEAHRWISTRMADLPAQIQGAEDAPQAAEAIKLFRTGLADGFRAEERSDDAALRSTDRRLEYLQRYIEREDRVREGVTEPRALDYSYLEERRWEAALEDHLRGGTVTVGRRAGLVPEEARAAMAANALADLRFDLLSDAQTALPNAAINAEAADSIKHLPEEIEQAASQADRIAAVQDARERIHAVQEKHSMVSSITQDVRNHLDEADRLLGKTYRWRAAGV